SGQGPAHVRPHWPTAIGESGDRLPMTEETNDSAVLLDEQRVRAGCVQTLHRLGGAQVGGADFADRLEDFAQGRHQAAAMARLTSRTVRAPSGIQAGAREAKRELAGHGLLDRARVAYDSGHRTKL